MSNSEATRMVRAVLHSSHNSATVVLWSGTVEMLSDFADSMA
jgi:hypothetical protein